MRDTPYKPNWSDYGSKPKKSLDLASGPVKGVEFRDSAFQIRFNEGKILWQAKLKPLLDGSRRSQQLSGEDFALRINSRPYEG